MNKLKIAGGLQENDTVVGNVYDKYGSMNPIVKMLMKSYCNTVSDFVTEASPKSIHEVGCGEGYWVLKWNKEGLLAKGTDFSEKVIDIARNNAKRQNISPEFFEVRSIYELERTTNSADLVVCCEVLEHLKSPENGLRALSRIAQSNVLISVPREPLWRILNMMRGKYLKRFGNTPGHIQHWSKKRIIRLIEKYFEIIDVKTPLPWTTILCRTTGKKEKVE